MSGPADPNALTRTAAPAARDDHRTRSAGDHTHDDTAGAAPLAGGVPTLPSDVSPLRPRLPAPLQYRDPDRYELQGEHGRGGLGRVLRARDRELGRPVAIKELLRPTAISELRFFREALITARLEHPSIVPVHEAGRWPDGTPFYAMKLVAGRPLRDAIIAAGPLERRLALIPHVIAVADAIAYAHSRRIIHRDLKPANVLVGDFGETVVIDWGLAKDLDSPDTSVDDEASPPERSSSLTVAGTMLGTPGYMPPEQEHGVADERSDVYALGGILFHVVLGNAPRAVGRAADPAVAVGVPAPLLAIITKAMATEPAQRYASARDFAQDLRDFHGGRLVSAHRYSLGQLIGHWASHNKRILAVAAAAALLLAVTLAVSARRVLDERTAAEGARDRAESAASALVLSHARSAVASDPTRALLWLSRYQGTDLDAARDLVAEAVGRGASRYVLNGHDQSVTRFAALDDGSLLSSSALSTLREWRIRGSDVTSRELAGALDLVGAFDYHRGRRRLVFATSGGDLVVRDAGAADRVVARVSDWLAVLELSPDGRRVITGTLAGDAHLIALDEPVAPVSLHAGVGLRVLAFVDDGRRVLFAGADGTVVALDGRTGARIASHRVAPAIEGTVGGGDRAVIVHADSTASLVSRDLATEATVAIPAGCRRAAISPDGALLALGCSDRLAVLALPSGALVHEQTHSVAPRYPQFSPDGRRLAVPVGDVVYLVSTTDWSTTPLRGHRGSISSQLAFVGDALVSGDEHGEIRVWPLPRDSRSSRAPGDLRNLVVSPDGSVVASTSDRGVLRLWESDGRLRRELRDGGGVMPAASFTADGVHVVAPGFDGKARVWPTTSAAPAVVLDAGDSRLMHAVAIGADVLTLGSDGRLLRWDVAARASTLVHRDPRGLMYADVRGARVVFGGEAGIVSEYDAATGRVVEITRHGGPLVGARVSPDGRRVLSVAADRTARLTTREPGVPPREVVLPARPINAHLSPDGRLLAVAAEDRLVRVYDVRDDGFHLRASHEADVRRMRFAPAGQVLAAACVDGIVRVWDLAAGGSATFPVGSETTYAVEFVDGGAAIVASTGFRLVRFPLPPAMITAATLSDLRDLVARLVPAYQRPTRASPDERLLFSTTTL